MQSDSGNSNTTQSTDRVILTTIAAEGEVAQTFVELVNHGEAVFDISGWRLRSPEAGDYVFPRGTRLEPHQVIRVYTNLYDADTGGFSFGRGEAIWRSAGGEGALLNGDGDIVSTLAYGDRARPPLTLEIAATVAEVTGAADPEFVDFTVLQLNDVYDVTPVEGGRRGGLARVATLRADLERENPNLLSVLVGDFLAPSAIGATTGDSGQHMIETLNAMKLSHAAIGNHEFDVGHDELLARIAESDFRWVSSNVSDGDGRPFAGVARNEIIEFTNPAGHSVRVALLGVCIDLFKSPWITYKDPIDSAREQVQALEHAADVFVTMTHLSIDEDKRLGAEVPRLDVLLGGHEHEAATAIVGDDATPIYKADSNARSVCIHRFRYDPRTGCARVHTELRQVDESLAEEPTTAAVVSKWQTITYNTLRAKGNEPLEVVGTATESLDGREAEVRSRPTNLTRLITETFLQEVPEADGVILGAGKVRIDGIIPPGDILFYDVVRIFPKNSGLSLLKMPGHLIRMLLDHAEASRGTGGYVHVANIAKDGDGWTIGGEPLVDETMYKIVMTELPVAYLAYPPFKGTGTEKLFDTRDMRSILADRLRRDRAALA